MSGIRIEGFRAGALGWVTQQHGAWYDRNWNFDLYFEALVARELADFLQRLEPTRDGFWVALDGDAFVGSISIDGQHAEGAGARVRWFITDPAVRGRGVGRRLMEEAMAFCKRAGFRRVYLHTFAGLDAARHLYEAHGFTLCHEQEDTTWGTPVREQEFEWLRA